MKLLKPQNGIIQIPIIIALAVVAIIGALIGYQLGDGSLFSFGVGLGVVLIFGPIIIQLCKKIKSNWSSSEN